MGFFLFSTRLPGPSEGNFWRVLTKFIITPIKPFSQWWQASSSLSVSLFKAVFRFVCLKIFFNKFQHFLRFENLHFLLCSPLLQGSFDWHTRKEIDLSILTLRQSTYFGNSWSILKPLFQTAKSLGLTNVITSQDKCRRKRGTCGQFFYPVVLGAAGNFAIWDLSWSCSPCRSR